MKLKPIVAKANEVEFILEDERHTFPNLLKDTLLKDSSVEFVSYKMQHPMDNQVTFILKTKGKPAKKALSDALKAIDAELDEFKQSVKSALK